MALLSVVELGSPVESRPSWTGFSNSIPASPDLTYIQSSSPWSRIANIDVFSVVADPLDGGYGMDTRIVGLVYSPLIGEPNDVGLTTIRL